MTPALDRARVVIWMSAALMTLNGWFCSPVRAQVIPTSQITIFAAASLKTALDVVAADYQTSSGAAVSVSYAASSALAKQIEQGAPADLFISADLDWMDYLAQKALIRTETRLTLLGNTLVLVAPVSLPIEMKISKNFPLADVLGRGKLAMANVAAVPAGKYGRAALEKLGVWSAVEPKVAQVENVRAALALVAREETILGIVYQTDAAAESKVKVVDTFPADTHLPIVYPLAITTDCKNVTGARAFVAYLQSPQALAHFVNQGFTIANR